MLSLRYLAYFSLDVLFLSGRDLLLLLLLFCCCCYCWFFSNLSILYLCDVWSLPKEFPQGDNKVALYCIVKVDRSKVSNHKVTFIRSSPNSNPFLPRNQRRVVANYKLVTAKRARCGSTYTLCWSTASHAWQRGTVVNATCQPQTLSWPYRPPPITLACVRDQMWRMTVLEWASSLLSPTALCSQ